MRRHFSIGISAAVCIAALAVSGVKLFAEDPKPASPPSAADQAAMMKAWEAYATPGPEHAELAKGAGEWDAKVEDLTPGMGNEVSMGTAKSTVIMGGRFLQEEFKGTMMGMPFEGMALTGYDNQRKEYFSTWIDSMGTGIMVSTGKMVGGKMEMSGDMTCPMQEKPATSKSTIVFESPDKHVMNMTMTAADGSPLGAMRITYTRKK
jgi:hypothetical protein